MFDDQTSHLEISVWDHDAAGKDDIMGRLVTLAMFGSTHTGSAKCQTGKPVFLHLLQPTYIAQAITNQCAEVIFY